MVFSQNVSPVAGKPHYFFEKRFGCKFQIHDTLRKEKYGEIIHSGDRRALAVLIRTLYLHKEHQKAAGKKFRAVDEQLLDRAQKLLHEEFDFVLNLQPQDVPPFIAKQMEITAK